MGIELEIAGDVLAEAIVVNELSKGDGSAKEPAEHQHACANCGTALAGAYCHSCGQTAHIHHSLLHMFEELLHGLFHFETKAWRTIPALMFRPGQLTRNYIAGQRTRYVSPLALFLFLIFLMFLVFSLTGGDVVNSISDKPHSRVGITKELAKTREKLTTLEAKRAQPALDAEKRADVEEDISDAKAEISALEKSLQRLDAKASADQADAAVVHDDANGDAGELEKKLDQKFTQKRSYSSLPWLDARIRHATKNSELAMYKLKSAASKFAFLLMPISLPFLWLLFAFRRKFTMFDHAVFSLYSLSFMALLLMLIALLSKLGLDGMAVALFLLAPPLHMFSQLRHAYQLGIKASIWRTVALLLVALCSLLIYVILIVGLST
ncbi:MAG: DUF3667 domain-containing protein [Burkholderiales bacterium]|nr:DUF3667 domain-containing protein [Burkholderiales bacterium]